MNIVLPPGGELLGLGCDVIEIERVRGVLDRQGERFLQRVFTEEERTYCFSHKLPHLHLAARFAAKEAIAKSLGAPAGMSWQDATVHRVPGGQPVVETRGTVAARAAELGVTRFHLSISHDAGIASAVVVAESDGV